MWSNATSRRMRYYFDNYEVASYVFNNNFYYLDSCESGNDKNWVPRGIRNSVQIAIHSEKDFEALLISEMDGVVN